MDEFRPLKLRVGNTDIATNQRIRVKGSHNMTLLPDFFMIDVFNMTDVDLAIVKDGGQITIIGKDDFMLCRGEVDDMYTHMEGVNLITTISILDGKKFYETNIRESIGAGASVRTTFNSIMRNASIGSFCATDKRIFRGQTFSGRLADSISMLARSVGARAFITMGAVHIVAKGMASEIVNINDFDIIEDADFAKGTRIIKTEVKGYPVGALVNVENRQYRLVSQKIDADNYRGQWDSHLVLVDEKEVTKMEGG